MRFNKKNRKGSFDVGNLMYYILPSLFVLMLILLAFMFIINGFKLDISYFPRGMQSSILTYRTMYSSNCFAYYDVDLLRTYPGVIDIDKFNQETFDNCLDSNKIVSLTLKDENEVIKVLTNRRPMLPEYGGSKDVLVYDKGIKIMSLDFQFKSDD